MGVPVMAKVCHAFLGMSKAIEGDLWQRIHNGSSKLWLPAITLFFFFSLWDLHPVHGDQSNHPLLQGEEDLFQRCVNREVRVVKCE